MTGDTLLKQFPEVYKYYQRIADKAGLWAEVLLTFEQSNLPDHSAKDYVERELTHALYEWDI